MPAAEHIFYPAEKIHIGWPGFGGTPPEPHVNGIDDLTKVLVAKIDEPCALIAHSMGGVIAIQAALARPDLVTHLILAATSGGMDLAEFGGQNWRDSVRNDYLELPEWFVNYREDLTGRLHKLRMPTLLLWGDSDPISPLGVGERLAACLPNSDLMVFGGAGHDLAFSHSELAGTLIDLHLNRRLRLSQYA